MTTKISNVTNIGMSLLEYVEEIVKEARHLQELCESLHGDLLAELGPPDELNEDNPKIHDTNISTEDTSGEAGGKS